MQDYTVFVSEDGGPFAPFVSNTAETAATFSGEDGKTYSFYSISRDLVGNVENAKTIPEATTKIVINVPDTTPPEIDPVADIVAEATSAAGAVVTYTPPATHDAVDGPGIATCTPASESTFPLGDTIVTCSAKDAAGNGDSRRFKVIVKDTIAPTISPTEDLTLEATSASGAIAIYSPPTTTDAVDGDGVASCEPVSGSVFGFGTTTVTCSAQDAAGNDSSDTFKVTVQDTTAPTLSVPDSIATEATGPTGAAVVFAATADDIVDGVVAVQCSPSSGSTFPIATTQVNCSATDARGNQARDGFEVEVLDTTPPVLTLNGPNPLIVECHTLFVDPGATAADLVAGNLTGAIQVSGSVNTHSLGTYTLTYTLSDGLHTTRITRTVFVVDTTAPTVTSLASSPSMLWPPNHKMVSVSIAVGVSDACDPKASCEIVSVSSNEPVNGLGDGDTAPDWIITGKLTVDLRAERAGNGAGRVYAVTIRCVDASGNGSTRAINVVVPHNR